MKFPNPITLKELAILINAQIVGNEEYEAIGINEIHIVENGEITFVDHPKYYDKALSSRASVVIINQKVDCPSGKHLLVCEDPFFAFITIGQKFRKSEKNENQIHQSAKIGAGTIIQPGAFVGNDVTIGDNCIIHSNVTIYDNCIIGNNVEIHANSVIGADAYYFQKKNGAYRKLKSCGRVVICDDVEIGALCAIDRGVTGDTTIGKGTKTDNHVQIGHDTIIGSNCLIGAHSAIAGVTKIEDDVILWAKVAVNKDLTIGKGAVILATSAVGKSLEGGKTYFGSPAVESRKKWKELAILNKLVENFQNKI